ncbi:MAG: hypothetical protein NLN64_01990 [Candidatus Thalassarchaeaceae archaeon]|jgi:hypothetical protein|nr:hypothetical protein [Candidatus Thalassarchaeaceae archaeon]|tara:strand:+ start:1947 stop:2132 length:186 start_codon:yes stop_codon:yes gene_type:complete
MIRELTIIGAIGLAVTASNYMAYAGSAGAGYKFGREWGTKICNFNDGFLDTVYTKLKQTEN